MFHGFNVFGSIVCPLGPKTAAKWHASALRYNRKRNDKRSALEARMQEAKTAVAKTRKQEAQVKAVMTAAAKLK